MSTAFTSMTHGMISVPVERPSSAQTQAFKIQYIFNHM